MDTCSAPGTHSAPGTPVPHRRRPAAASLAAALAATLALAGCTPATTSGTGGAASTPAPTTLTVVTHDSFALPQGLLDAFAAQSGLAVTYLAPGDAGTVVNQLVLTKSAPIADVVFGIDNTFAGRALAQGVLAPYTSPALPSGLDALQADASGSLTPIDYGDVCLNADTAWFAEHALAVPATLDDLLKPEYKGLLVVSSPASSSPGLAFLAATVGAYGESGYLGYWAGLRDNGLKVDSGWTEAYTVDFSGSSGHGAYPLVLSYASSPASEVGDDGVSRTQALPQTCFRQVEYAGVIAGAKNPSGAQQFIDFLLSADVQSAIPDNMWMSPVNPDAAVPSDWAKYTGVVTAPIEVPATLIADQRDAWIKAWTNTVLG